MVNITLSNFVEIARTLDVEVMLIPKKELSLVENIIESKKTSKNHDDVKSAYSLDDEPEEEEHV